MQTATIAGAVAVEIINGFFTGEPMLSMPTCLQTWPEYVRPYLVGGAIRNLWLQTAAGAKLAPPRDLDIIVTGVRSTDELEAMIAGTIIRRTRFGGFECRLPELVVPVDVWRIEDDVTSKTAEPVERIEDVLKNSILNVDAIAWDIRNEQLMAIDFPEKHVFRVRPRAKITPDVVQECVHVVCSYASLYRYGSFAPEVNAFIARVAAAIGRETLRHEVAKVLPRKFPEATENWSSFVMKFLESCKA